MALESRLRDMEAIVEGAVHPKHANSSHRVTSETRQSLGSSQSTPDRSTYDDDDRDESSAVNKFVLTRHAIEEGEAGFQGYSADRAFIQRLREKLKNWQGAEVHRRFRALESEQPKLFEIDYGLAATACLPPKEKSRALIDAALDSQPLLAILHRPSFEYTWNIVYTIEPAQYTVDEIRFLPLLYAVLALGCTVSVSHSESPGEFTAAEGLQYFAASRSFLELGDCIDETALQTLVFLNLFLIATARAATCYSYLTHALTLALRRGLHRRSLPRDDDYIQREVGKRVFWTIRLLGNSVATLTGMPSLLDDENVDQDLPVEANDIYITKSRILPQPACEPCQIAGTNAHIRLCKILDRVVRHIYPRKQVSQRPGEGSASYMVSVDKITEIETALREWTEELPFGFRLGRDSSFASLLLAQYLLSLSYAHVQIYLYRPFLHYISKPPHHRRSTARSNVDFSSYAAACVQACNNVVMLGVDMCNKGLLQRCHSTVMSILFGTLLSLMYRMLDSTETEGMEAAVKAIVLGRKVMGSLAQFNTRAETAQNILGAMIGLLPAEFADTRVRLQNYDSEVVNPVAPGATATNMSPGRIGYDGHRRLAENEDDCAVMTPFPCDTTYPRSLRIPLTSAYRDGRPDAASSTSFDSTFPHSHLPAGITPYPYVSLGPGRTRHGEAGEAGNTIEQPRSADTSRQFTFPTTTSPTTTECHRGSTAPHFDDPAKFVEAQPFSFPASELGALMRNDSTSFPAPADQVFQNVGPGELMDLFHPSSMNLLQMSDLVDFTDVF